ncbi:MAG: amidohydrolase [Bacteroidetes bacterium]|nr:amidohydrolase [Bacteroidota bacterium]
MKWIGISGLAFVLFFAGCIGREQADLLVFNARINTLDSAFTEVEAMAIKDGKVLATGSQKQLESIYSFQDKMDLEGAFVYPAWIDAHCHFYGYGLFSQQCDLSGTQSINEIVERCIKFSSRRTDPCLRGRGWDQNLFASKQFPENDALNEAFPDLPVFLKRVDGHAALCNDAALKLAGIDGKTSIEGGEIILKNGRPTGILLDAAADFVESKLPRVSRKEQIHGLMEAQRACFEMGLSSLHDAGLDIEQLELIDSLQEAGALKIRLNIMLNATRQNLNYLTAKGGIKKPLLQVNSFKLYADGALGSRGACLKAPYSDRPHHFGFLVSHPDTLREIIRRMAASPFQLNTHCIGDSGNAYILNLYAEHLKGDKTRRWRIEHAQVVTPSDRSLYGQNGIIPSVQPTHASSDLPWAAERLGPERISHGYAYKSLLKENGWLPLGTDFPVEAISPYKTLYAAVAREDKEESLTREEALRGMTVWAAKAGFQEKELGSLESGKWADFVVLDYNLRKDILLRIRDARARKLYIAGKQVFSLN